jgi:apolipoprotein N-acyltransferase
MFLSLKEGKVREISWRRFLAGVFLVILLALSVGVPLFFAHIYLGVVGLVMGAGAGGWLVRWVIRGSGGDLFHYPSEYGGR